MALGLGEPAERRRCAFAETGQGVDQHFPRWSTPKATGVTQRQHAFDPTMALRAACPLASLAPQHPTTMRTFRGIGHVKKNH